MTHEEIQRRLEDCVEELAAIEHARWSHWQKYLHSKGQKNSDGSLILPPELVSQWEKQASTPYEELSPREQESDREQVYKYFPLLLKQLSTSS